VENKNNTDLAWATQMVSEGWFETCSFLYGPVGHTHNEIDARHSQHNIVSRTHIEMKLACMLIIALSFIPASLK
jgi:hypothetical protein